MKLLLIFINALLSNTNAKYGPDGHGDEMTLDKRLGVNQAYSKSGVKTDKHELKISISKLISRNGLHSYVGPINQVACLPPCLSPMFLSFLTHEPLARSKHRPAGQTCTFL